MAVAEVPATAHEFLAPEVVVAKVTGVQDIRILFFALLLI